jgi:hypothetical protein
MAFLPINELVELSIKHLGSGTASSIRLLCVPKVNDADPFEIERAIVKEGLVGLCDNGWSSKEHRPMFYFSPGSQPSITLNLPEKRESESEAIPVEAEEVED